MFTCDHRFIVSPEVLTNLLKYAEVTEDFVWVGSKGSRGKQRLRRYSLRGIPAKRIDLALLATVEPNIPICVEIGRKTGKFDTNVRTQIVVRHWKGEKSQPLPHGRLMISVEDTCPPELCLDPEGISSPIEGQWAVISAMWLGRTVTFPKSEQKLELSGGSWMEAYPMLTSSLDNYDLCSVVMWHWNRYYCFLSHEEAETLGKSFETLHPNIRQSTLAETNRLASRELYRLARSLGWQKLCRKEKERWGIAIDSPQWHKEEVVQAARLRMSERKNRWNGNGVGDSTIRTAHGIYQQDDFDAT